ncbi:MAG: lysophospholipid acyltransferase family protein [Verrucomicrobiales bacterium]|nr:lysophospholipid acyltransferase family protein [Verrucomicrobiales bacterium]
MLEFSDAPYQFFEAKHNRFITWLARQANRGFVLRGGNHRISELRIDGQTEAVREAQTRGERLLFVANHPSHSDPQVATEVHRQLGADSCFMAAYDVFLRNKSAAWVMQRFGNFSIDREGSDRKAMTAAIDTLKAGRQSLTIFPEGNVYLTNDRVTPFLDGTAFIALKAQAALKETPLKIIPISLKFTHLTTPRASVTDRMLQLAKDCGYAFPDGSQGRPIGSVLVLGQHIVSNYLQEHGYSGAEKEPDEPLYETLKDFATHLVTELESALSIEPQEGVPLIDRIRKIRSKIHQMRTNESGETHPEIDGLADKAILAFRVNGYLTPYLTEHSTIDRYDETVERVAEDFYSKAMPRTGPRRALVHIGEPLDVQDYLERAGGKARQAVGEMTCDMESAVQSGVDVLNESNDAPGATVISD